MHTTAHQHRVQWHCSVRIYMYIHIFIHAYMHSYIDTKYIHMNSYIYEYIYTYFVYAHTKYMNVCIYTYMHIQKYIYIYSYIYKCMYIYFVYALNTNVCLYIHTRRTYTEPLQSMCVYICMHTQYIYSYSSTPTQYTMAYFYVCINAYTHT